MSLTNNERLTDQYDRRAYEQMLRDAHRKRNRAQRINDRIGDAIGSAGSRATNKISPTASTVMRKPIETMLSGLRSLVIEPAFRSVSTARVMQAYAHAGYPVAELQQITQLHLRTIDDVIPPLEWRYGFALAAEGAAVGAIITGAEIVAAVGSVASAGAASAPSAGAVAGAMASDAALVLGGSIRLIAHIGAYFGHDLRHPEEQVFALSVINWSSAGTEGTKTIAFNELSRLTQQLVRGAPWAQLSEHAIVGVVDKLFVRLGFRLTKEKLGQAVPLLGIAIGAGLNAQLLHSVGRDAVLAYRMRHLIEIYELDTSEFAGSPATDREILDTEEVGVTELLEAAQDNTEIVDDTTH